MPSLAVDLRANTADFQSDMGKASHIAERELEGLVARATALGTMLGNALGNIATHYVHAAQEVLKMGDELSKLSQRSAFTVERLSELRFAAELADVSFGQMQTSLGFFAKTLAEAQNESSRTGQVFAALGVDVKQGPQQAFEQFARAINALPDGEQKVAAMRIAFGRAGDALIPMIAGLKDATEKAQALGVVMSAQLAKDSERFNDAMKSITLAGNALVIEALTPMSRTLADIAEKILQAKMNGDLWKGTLIEMGKVVVSTMGAIVSLGGLAAFPQNLAQSAFNRLDKLHKPVLGPQAADDEDAELGRNIAASRINKAALQAAIDRRREARVATGRVSSEMSFDELMAKNAMKRIQMVEAAEAAADKEAEKRREEERREREKDVEDQLARARRIQDADNRGMLYFRSEIEKLNKASEKTDDWAKSLGMTFSSAFEDAVLHGKKFRDVLQGIGADIARILLRKTVTEPLAKAVGKFFESASGGGGLSGLFDKIFSGGADVPSAGGGYRMAGTPLLVGEEGPEYFVPNTHGTIMPNHALGGGALVVTVNNHIDSRTDRAEVAMIVEQRTRAAVSEVFERVRRGSADRRMLRG